MYSAQRTLLHRLATASKPNNCNLWQWHERESHYSTQESSRTTGIQTVCVQCVNEQCCWVLTLHSLRDTWMNEWMNEWVLCTGGKTLKGKPEHPVPIVLCHHKYIQTGQWLNPCNGSDMLTLSTPPTAQPHLEQESTLGLYTVRPAIIILSSKLHQNNYDKSTSLQRAIHWFLNLSAWSDEYTRRSASCDGHGATSILVLCGAVFILL